MKPVNSMANYSYNVTRVVIKAGMVSLGTKYNMAASMVASLIINTIGVCRNRCGLSPMKVRISVGC